ncbi:hypothetical protein [Emticicia agri]|uniref:AlgX/AlgJ SGNH hydrolase-like domain-containing protein n=1 Tax=Emticicia agri TaxID=2492393 RepID=A0A4Q5LVC0_9BACT|nr:hypothetical protein [Emticicia agri]RYU93489.1 hypothetical protein EWM59_21960 [Emticicia agri]
MNKKIIKYTTLIIFSVLWLLGFSPHISKWLYEKGIIEDDYRFGDLYRFSNLPQFRVLKQVCEPGKMPVTKPNTALYLIGDSFTEEGRIEAGDFVSGSFHRFFIGHQPFVKLDKTKKNVLVIETVERHFRERFATPYKNLTIGEPTTQQAMKSLMKEAKSDFWYDSERHESVLFSSGFFLTIKEWKAILNDRLFDRTDGNVVVSKDKKNIFYELDARPSGITSTFDKISDKEIELLVKNVNLTYDFYRNNGFDEVYLTIAPNKSSVLGTDLGEYNHLIERIQKHPALHMPFFDIYTPLNTSGKMLYDAGDTHWNCEGKQIWINAVNQKL